MWNYVVLRWTFIHINGKQLYRQMGQRECGYSRADVYHILWSHHIFGEFIHCTKISLFY